jgi:hypothetical protein
LDDVSVAQKINFYDSSDSLRSLFKVSYVKDILGLIEAHLPDFVVEPSAFGTKVRNAQRCRDSRAGDDHDVTARRQKPGRVIDGVELRQFLAFVVDPYDRGAEHTQVEAVINIQLRIQTKHRPESPCAGDVIAEVFLKELFDPDLAEARVDAVDGFFGHAERFV